MTEPLTTTYGRLLIAKIAIIRTRFLLRTIGFAGTIRFMSMIPQLRSRTAPDERWPGEIAMAARPPLGGTCLDRTALLWLLYRINGLDADIRIGIVKAGDGIDAHAWLEHHGAVVNDDPDIAASFAVFDEDPSDLVFV